MLAGGTSPPAPPLRLSICGSVTLSEAAGGGAPGWGVGAGPRLPIAAQQRVQAPKSRLAEAVRSTRAMSISMFCRISPRSSRSMTTFWRSGITANT
jgi:hypothetical protein